ncbi:MAG: hypothetical protein ACOCV4_05715 [Myxococcota bacterium]
MTPRVARVRPGLALCTVVGCLLGAAEARAQGPGDGVYGRFDASWTMSLGVGAGASRRTEGGDAVPSVVGELRFRHLDSAGPFVAGRWAPEGHGHVVVGAEIRPLFPLLFLENLFTGHERWDLLIESWGLELGAAVLPFDGEAGVGLAMGTGLEVPLVLSSTRARGLGLRLAFRYVHAPDRWQAGPARDASEWTALATLAVDLALPSGGASIRPPRGRR